MIVIHARRDRILTEEKNTAHVGRRVAKTCSGACRNVRT